MAGGPCSTGRGRPGEQAAVADKKAAILERALEHHPQSDRLLVELLRLVRPPPPPLPPLLPLITPWGLLRTRFLHQADSRQSFEPSRLSKPRCLMLQVYLYHLKCLVVRVIVSKSTTLFACHSNVIDGHMCCPSYKVIA